MPAGAPATRTFTEWSQVRRDAGAPKRFPYVLCDSAHPGTAGASRRPPSEPNTVLGGTMNNGNRSSRRTAVLAAVAAAAALAVPAAASAAVTGAVTGDTATLTGDAAADNIIISVNNGLLQHNLGTAAGFADATDFDSTAPGGADPDRGSRQAHDRWRRGRRQRHRRPRTTTPVGGDGNDRITGFTGDDDDQRRQRQRRDDLEQRRRQRHQRRRRGRRRDAHQRPQPTDDMTVGPTAPAASASTARPPAGSTSTSARPRSSRSRPSPVTTSSSPRRA